MNESSIVGTMRRACVSVLARNKAPASASGISIDDLSLQPASKGLGGYNLSVCNKEGSLDATVRR